MFTKFIRLGDTPSGETVHVSIAVRACRETDEALELSINSLVSPNGELATPVAIEKARQVIPSEQWSESDLARLCDLWEQYSNQRETTPLPEDALADLRRFQGRLNYPGYI